MSINLALKNQSLSDLVRCANIPPEVTEGSTNVHLGGINGALIVAIYTIEDPVGKFTEHWVLKDLAKYSHEFKNFNFVEDTAQNDDLADFHAEHRNPNKKIPYAVVDVEYIQPPNGSGDLGSHAVFELTYGTVYSSALPVRGMMLRNIVTQGTDWVEHWAFFDPPNPYVFPSGSNKVFVRKTTDQFVNLLAFKNHIENTYGARWSTPPNPKGEYVKATFSVQEDIPANP